jgi:Holliday junction resolvasome RuvABC endonuclease subunit
MKILAIDPATSCGFAIGDNKQLLAHGVWNLGAGRPIEAQHRELENQLLNAIAAYDCGMIATENAGFGSRNPAVQAMHNERLGVIRLVACRSGCEVRTFQPTTIKAYATGSGRAKKPQMIASLKTHFGIEIDSDDEADAIWIWHLATRPDCWAKKAATAKSKRKSKVPRGKQPKLFG